MQLNSQDLERLDAALRLVFTPNDLKRLLKYRLNRDLENVTLAQSYVDLVFDLLDTAMREGWIDSLIVAMREERKENGAFCRVVDDLIAGKTVSRDLNPERLLNLAKTLSDLLTPVELKESLQLIGRDFDDPKRYPSLKDYIVIMLMSATQEGWGEDR